MIYTNFTNGFGNNIFQYNAARVLAEHLGDEVLAVPPNSGYYGIGPLEALGVKFAKNLPGNLVTVNDSAYVKAFRTENYKNKNILLNGYFEDYRFYLPLRSKIKSWFPKVEERNNNDLVLHMRTGDRLFMKNEFYTKPKPESFIKAIEKFDFDRLHIVSDMPKWDYITEAELMKTNFHLKVPKSESVPIKDSVDYFNSFIEGFSKFDPIYEKRDVHEDFNFIRGFRNILFEHGTLSWWAAFLSDAEKVGVYGPWRSWKGKGNKNLSNVQIDTWFKWE
jgi:hypothetical protein